MAQTCPDCGCTRIEYFQYELTCQKCGLVVGGSYIDDLLENQAYGYSDQVAIWHQDAVLTPDVEAHLSEMRNILTRYTLEDFSDSFYSRFKDIYMKSIAYRPVKGRNKQLRLLGVFLRTQRKLDMETILTIIQSDMKQLQLTEKELIDEAKIVWESASRDKDLRVHLVEFKQVEQDNIQKHLGRLSFDADKKKEIVRVYDKLKKRLPERLLIRTDILDWTLIFMAGRFLNLNMCLKEYEKRCGISYTTILKTEKTLKMHLVASKS